MTVAPTPERPIEILASGTGRYHPVDPDGFRAHIRDNKDRSLTPRLMTAKEAVSRFVADGDYLTYECNYLMRGPNAVIHEIIRQQKKDLWLAGKFTYPDVAMLVGAGAAVASLPALPPSELPPLAVVVVVVLLAMALYLGLWDLLFSWLFQLRGPQTGAIVLVHIALVVRQGIAPRPHVLETGAPQRTDHPEYAAYYRTTYQRSKSAGVPFWPQIVAKDLVVGAGVVLVIALLAGIYGAGLEAPADPTDASYVPHPEWYFLPFFELLKLVPGSMESVVAVGAPAAIVLALLLLPLFDRGSTRSLGQRPASRFGMFAILGGMAMLIGSSVREEAPTAVAPEVGRPLTSVERAGRALFKRQQCGGCHAVGSEGGAEKGSDAPDLTEVGLRHSGAWLHSFLEQPERFHPDTKMPAYGPPSLSHQEIEEITRYLASLRGKNWATATPEFRDTFPETDQRKERKP